jgi:hypothetical protein
MVDSRGAHTSGNRTKLDLVERLIVGAESSRWRTSLEPRRALMRRVPVPYADSRFLSESSSFATDLVGWIMTLLQPSTPPQP